MNLRLKERASVWMNVYNRIRFTKRMYPLPAIAKDVLNFPIDYFVPDRDISTLRNITIAITRKCNIRCKMCFFWKELDDKNQMSLETFKKLIDQAKATRPCVILTGGEPFAHPNIIEMVAYAKENGLPVQIFTNGTIVKPAMADKLVELGLDYINFTLLGDEKSHVEVAQASSSYIRFVENLEYFAANRGNTRVLMNFTITPESVGDMGHAIELANKYHLDGIRYQHYNFVLPGDCEMQEKMMKQSFGIDNIANDIENGESVAPMADKIVDFIDSIDSLENSVPIGWAPTLTEDEIRNWYSDEDFETYRKCMFPWRGMLVDTKGKLMPCNKIYMELGDVEKDDLFEVWNNERMKKFRRIQKETTYPACSRCCKL